MEKMEAASLCKKHMHRYVLIQMNNGAQYDGIVENVDEENVVLAVPISEMNMNMAAPISNAPYPHCGDQGYRINGYGGYPGYGYGGYGGYGFGYPGYGFYGPRRRFRRLVLPLAALTALSLLPYF